MLNYIINNFEVSFMVFQAVLSALAGLFQLIGWTKASKLMGTFTALDAGRILRYLKSAKGAVDAVKKASTASIIGFLPILLLLGCGSQNQQQPLVCPIPSSVIQYVEKAPQIIEKTSAAVEATKEAVKDPKLGAIVNAIQLILDVLPVVANKYTGQVSDVKATIADVENDIGKACDLAKGIRVFVYEPTDKDSEKYKQAFAALETAIAFCGEEKKVEPVTQ